jgi:hypothetical protein
MYIAQTADNTIPKRIRSCMDTLERLSEIWLAAQSVFDVTETVLKDEGFENCLKSDAKTGSNGGQSPDQKSDEAAKIKLERQAVLDSATSFGDHLEPKNIKLTPSSLLRMLASPNPCNPSVNPGKKVMPTEIDPNSKSEWGHSHGEPPTYDGSHIDAREAQAALRLPEDKPRQVLKADESPKFAMFEFPPAEACCDPGEQIGTRLQTTTSQNPLGQGLCLSQDEIYAKILDAQKGYFTPEEGFPQCSTLTNEIEAAAGGLGYLWDSDGSAQPLAHVQFGVGEWSVISITYTYSILD